MPTVTNTGVAISATVVVQFTAVSITDKPSDTIPTWTLGDRLHKARRHANLDQADMAKIIGCARSSISMWENDEARPRDTIDVIYQWAAATGVDPGWIIGLTESPPQFRTGRFSTYCDLPYIPAHQPQPN